MPFTTGFHKEIAEQTKHFGTFGFIQCFSNAVVRGLFEVEV